MGDERNYSEAELRKAMKVAFKAGLNWAETYQGWFIPKKKQTKLRLEQAQAAGLRKLNNTKSHE